MTIDANLAIALAFGVFCAAWPEKAGYLHRVYLDFVYRGSLDTEERDRHITTMHRLLRWAGVILTVGSLTRIVGLW